MFRYRAVFVVFVSHFQPLFYILGCKSCWFLLLSMHYLVQRLLGRRYVGVFVYIAGEWVTNTKSG